MSKITNIEELWNHYGVVCLKEDDGKFYWGLEDLDTPLDDPDSVNKWKEIPEHLYAAIMLHLQKSPHSSHDLINLLKMSTKNVNNTTAPLKAPWVDYKGNDLYLGDLIKHPMSGETGKIFYCPEKGTIPSDQWYVDYEDSTPPLRLCLQVGNKGQAVVVKKNNYT